MNPMIDLALFMAAVTALALMWPFARNLARLMDELEDEYIARQLEEARAWHEDRDDYDIHKSL